MEKRTFGATEVGGSGLTAAVLALGEHLLSPRRCLVCGRSLQGAIFALSEVPVLCERCEAALPRIEGDLCGRCGAPLVSEIDLCMVCRDRQSSLETLRALYAYREGAVSLIHALKEAGEPRVARYLADEILRRRILSSETSLIVPIPPSRRGKKRRGFDQSRLLTRALSQRTGLPRNALLSRRRGGAQKELDREGRLSNVASQLRLVPGAFRVDAPPPAEVTLLDDVVTTGATLEAAAALLKRSGVERVRAVVIARD